MGNDRLNSNNNQHNQTNITNHYPNLSASLNTSIDISLVGLGQDHSCVSTIQYGLQCFGVNNHGQTDIPESVRMHTSTLASGSFFNCAVGRDGVECWGDNSTGQLQVPEGVRK